MPIVELPDSIRGDFGVRPLLSSHDLHQRDLFTDDALIELLDGYPREHLYALTMGTDDFQTDQNRLALHDGVSGASLLKPVKNGRLWLNITQVHRADRRYRDLIDELFAQLRAQIPGFSPVSTEGTLLISSPNVLVYYHADASPSVLWHLRGQKRIWIYPALDEHYIKRDHLEDIYAGVRHEYLPFDPSFDRAAVVYELQPGQWLSWPHNAPHRITNLGSVNVSLSTEYVTRESRAHARVHVANRYFRTRLGFRNLSDREGGVSAFLKTNLHRVARKIGLDPLNLKQHVPAFRVDPDAPRGVVSIKGAAIGTIP